MELPEFDDIDDKYQRTGNHELTALEKFIHNNEPAGDLAALFRTQLSNALNEECEDLTRQLAEAREEIGKMDSMYQDRLLDMEARACKATEDLGLCSKSYDANVKGYLEDIDDLCNQLRVARKALSDISGSGPVDLKGKRDPYAGWSWCYDRAKLALRKMGGV